MAATCAEARANWDAAVATPGGEGASSGMLMAERQVMFEHPTTWHVEHMEPPAIRAMFRLGAQFPFFHSLLRHRAPNPSHLRGRAHLTVAASMHSAAAGGGERAVRRRGMRSRGGAVHHQGAPHDLPVPAPPGQRVAPTQFFSWPCRLADQETCLAEQVWAVLGAVRYGRLLGFPQRLLF